MISFTFVRRHPEDREESGLSLVHKRSVKILELRRMYRQAYRDRERAETVAILPYPILGISRGEVIRSPHYLNPSLQKTDG